MRQLRAKGYSFDRIRTETGWNDSTAKTYAGDVTPRPGAMLRNWLDASSRAKLFADVERGDRSADIARRYGVKQSSVSVIACRQRRVEREARA